MNTIITSFVERLNTINKTDEIFQALADSFQVIDKEIYSVCLKVDSRTYEIVPARDIDRILINNIKDALERGICGQISDPNKVVLISDHKRFAFREDDRMLLLPLFQKQVQYGIVVVVFPEKLLDTFEMMRGDLNMIGIIASKFFDLLYSIDTEKHLVKERTDTENRLANIVENVVHGLIALDNNHMVSIFNKNAEIIFNIASSAVIGKSYREAFSQKLVRVFDVLVENTLIEGSILDYEFEMELSPTLKIPIGISTSILLDSQGIHQGIIFLCRDMSLTKEINRLKELDKMKSEFVSMVSHELKNPIAVIKSSVETLLAARNLGKKLDDNFETNSLSAINDEINRLSQLINDILSLARIESGRVEIRKEPANIEQLIHSTINVFKINEETHPISVSVENIDHNILLDSDKVRIVLINYISNAIKYSPNGSPINIYATLEGEEFKVTVSDNGIGIPDDKLSSIFDKFSRVLIPETQSIKGTGLGLSICQKIIELHHGRVWCDSKFKKGSTFGFSIPISDFSRAN